MTDATRTVLLGLDCTMQSGGVRACGRATSSDGKGCGGLEGNCCASRPSFPWFNKVLNTTT
uniref:Uncharacterized protein n=1 Tax=Amphimedon queenslandica TaxID=400682 RepID=A0A1X7U7F2_AMPQE